MNKDFFNSVRRTSVFLQTFQELNSYIKYERSSLTTLTNTEKRVDLCNQPDQTSVYDNPFYSWKVSPRDVMISQKK